MSEGEPEMHPGNQVDAYVDSQGTMVDDSSQIEGDLRQERGEGREEKS